MILAFRLGDVQIKPSAVESSLLVGGVTALAWGLWTGKTGAALVGAAVGGAVGYRCYEKAVDVKAPELMNGYYMTGGELSATSGDPAEADTLRRMLGIDTRSDDDIDLQIRSNMSAKDKNRRRWLNRPNSEYGGDSE